MQIFSRSAYIYKHIQRDVVVSVMKKKSVTTK